MSNQEQEHPLRVKALVLSGLEKSSILMPQDREELAQAVADSVKERVLRLLLDEDETRAMGNTLQEALLGGGDLLEVATDEGIAGEDAFAESFSVSLASVLDEVVEVSEEHDADDLRRRLHAAVTEALHQAIAERQRSR